MTSLQTATTETSHPVQISASAIASAAVALGHAGRWAEASELVEAASASSPEDRAVLALAAARSALEHDWFRGTDESAGKLREATELVDSLAAPRDELRWDLGFLALRHAYGQQMFGPSAPATLGPEGRDPERSEALRAHAEELRESAPDERRQGWADFYLGVIADNAFGDRDAAPVHYEEALRKAEAHGDLLLEREALRHLGDHDHDSGDAATATARWERATAAGAEGGTVQGTLSQMLLLAVLAHDSGDRAGAAAIAREIVRWANAIGASRVAAQARSFLDGSDPTAPDATIPEGDSSD